jgi:hypothetical protein
MHTCVCVNNTHSNSSQSFGVLLRVPSALQAPTNVELLHALLQTMRLAKALALVAIAAVHMVQAFLAAPRALLVGFREERRAQRSIELQDSHTKSSKVT